jgi:hypothetical protein
MVLLSVLACQHVMNRKLTQELKDVHRRAGVWTPQKMNELIKDLRQRYIDLNDGGDPEILRRGDELTDPFNKLLFYQRQIVLNREKVE